MASRIANVEMAAAWNGDEGAGWARDWDCYDRSLRGHHERLLMAAAISDGERVLDIGCGNGESTRGAARATPGGEALGIDLSSQMIERARALAEGERLMNARFEQGDAQVHPFEADAYDLVLSRFGAMFFADPDRVTSVLTAVGLDDLEVTESREPFWAGTDASDAFSFISAGGPVRGLLEGLEPDDQARALERLQAALTARDTGEGVFLGSAAWVVSARRP